MTDAHERERDQQAAPAWRGYVRWTLRGVLGAALTVGGAWVWDAVVHAEALRLRTLYVGGAFERVAESEVYARVRPHLADNFFQLDLDAVRAEVEALPWVARAAVRREWPGTLRVEFTEEVPVATWQGRMLLNADAIPFVGLAGTDAAELPALVGPEGSAPVVLATLRDMQRAAGERLPSIVKLQLSERRAWEVWFGDGTRVRLGRRDALARLSRFAEVAAPLVGPQAEHVAYVDMRYANGFTVGWRGATAAARPPERTGASKAKRKRTDV